MCICMVNCYFPRNSTPSLDLELCLQLAPPFLPIMKCWIDCIVCGLLDVLSAPHTMYSEPFLFLIFCHVLEFSCIYCVIFVLRYLFVNISNAIAQFSLDNGNVLTSSAGSPVNHARKYVYFLWSDKCSWLIKNYVNQFPNVPCTPENFFIGGGLYNCSKSAWIPSIT